MQVTTPCRNSDTSANKGLKTRLLTLIRDMREGRSVEKGTSFINFDKKKNRDQHVTAYETYTITCIADLKKIAAVPREVRHGIPRGSRLGLGGVATPREVSVTLLHADSVAPPPHPALKARSDLVGEGGLSQQLGKQFS